ncbi:MAG TPA: hypothetical protein VGQ06_07755 [Gemmatimonadales bacterium]|jgi:hypothetical protein|nr:hypothetical protein [Gemmatimonadales bacterium]
MGKINLTGVIIGGLVAGVVLNVVDSFMFMVVLKNDMAAAMVAMGKPAQIPVGQILWYVFLDFLFGIFLVWLYAAVRPRFGAGPATAMKAGLIGWVATGLFHALFEWPMAMMPHNILVIVTLVALVQQPLAVVAGAKFYTEM